MYYLSSAVAIAAAIYFITNITTAILIGCVCYVIVQHKWIYLFVRTFPRDVSFLISIIRIMVEKISVSKNGKIVADIFSDTVKKNPNKTAIISADTNKKMTFKEVEDFSNKIANIFQNYGYCYGDVVGLYMKNEVEYVPSWLGLSKLGIITGLINNNLCGESLRYVIEAGNCKAIILQADLKINIDDIKHLLHDHIQCFILDDTIEADGYVLLKHDLEKASNVAPTKPESLTLDSKMLYIYTSGTTGLPKASIVVGMKVLLASKVFGYFTNVKEDDIVYNVLPLYHTSGGMIFATQMIMNGCTLVIRKKFSVSQFFDDCIKHNVTYIGYIGEMCRYLLLKPESPVDRSHKIRVAVGNGMRNSLSSEFKKRFGIKEVQEFYGATEANMGNINTTNKDGVLGFQFVSLWFLNTKQLIRIDPENDDILRDENGLGIQCKPGETGLLVNCIFKGAEFDGYIDRKATEKKVAHNVIKKGDSVYITGDLLVQDQLGHLYFVDRLGDSYRWKGENTSSTQVENILSAFLNLKDILVYPVFIPNNEGNAGMAYIHMEANESFDLEAFTDHINKYLPKYSTPLFLRTGATICVTGTQKHQKGLLKKEGYDLEFLKEGEQIYFYNNMRYTSFTKDLYERLQTGDIRL